jgi:uracil-DNA glycosylase
MRACRQCLEAGFSVTPGAVFSGPASARLMIVGQAPGVTECETGRPFNGSSGQRLFEWLAESGWDESTFRAAQYMTAITKCYPGRSPNGKGDRAPTRAEQRLCAPYLKQELALVEPDVVVPVGSMAVRRFLRYCQMLWIDTSLAANSDGVCVNRSAGAGSDWNISA